MHPAQVVRQYACTEHPTLKDPYKDGWRDWRRQGLCAARAWGNGEQWRWWWTHFQTFTLYGCHGEQALERHAVMRSRIVHVSYAHVFGFITSGQPWVCQGQICAAKSPHNRQSRQDITCCCERHCQGQSDQDRAECHWCKLAKTAKSPSHKALGKLQMFWSVLKKSKLDFNTGSNLII